MKKFLVGSALLALMIIGFVGCEQATTTSSQGSITSEKEVTALNVVGADKAVHLTWTNPKNADFNGVEITMTPAQGTLTSPVTLTKEDSAYKVSGLQNNATYVFTVKTLDKTSNKSKGVIIIAMPKQPTSSATASITNITLSQNSMDTQDPNRSITVTITGTALSAAKECNIQFDNSTPVPCVLSSDTTATATITNISTIAGTYSVKALLQTTETSSLTSQKEEPFTVVEPVTVTKMTVTKEDGSAFLKDAYDNMMVDLNTTGTIKVVLTGTNFTNNRTSIGVLWRETVVEAQTKTATEATIIIPIPQEEGKYPIKAQIKPYYQTNYAEPPTSTTYKPQNFRVRGKAKLLHIMLPGFATSKRGDVSWIIIKGENFDTLNIPADVTITPPNGMGTIGTIQRKDSSTLRATYTFPYENILGKKISVSIGGKTITAPFTVYKVDETGTLTGYYGSNPTGALALPYCTSIGDYAFDDCSGLTSVSIPDSVTSIGFKAFLDCSGLTSVSIGNSVTTIGTYAFLGCSGLTSVSIPDSVTLIGESAFSRCSGLTSVSIGNSVTTIRKGAFSDCSKLTSITIPDSVTSIGDSAFGGCKKLTEIKVSTASATYKDIDGVLYSKDGTTLIMYPKGKQGISYTIPNSVKSIGNSAFSSCSGLESITIPDGVTTIGDSVFSSCSGLESITIPDGVTTIGDWAFFGCTGLRSITIPDSVKSIGYRAFSKCSGFTSISIGNSVTTIGGSAFADCSSLVSIFVPDSVTSIGSWVFSDCSNLMSITLSNTITKLSEGIFAGCSNLLSITIPDSVTSIGDSAFSRCNKATIYVPNTTIEYLARYKGVANDKIKVKTN